MEKKDQEGEPTAVSIYVRPLEVTLTSEDIEAPPPVPQAPPPIGVQTTSRSVEENTKRVWSTMSARIETETSVKRWSTPMIRTEEGTPPGPEDHPTTKQGRTLDGNVKTITPNYKIGEEKPSTDITLGRLGHLPEGYGDYKVSMRHEDYKQTFIDPKVKDFANMPSRVSAVPDAKKTIVGDFPSAHSKRSLINLEPLEQRRFKSVESRPITTSNYLTESVERHRDTEASVLRPYLKTKESDANQPWNKPGWTGPKKSDDESMRELEQIKKSIETLQKAANQPPKTDELDRLGKNREQLEKSREMRASYKLIDSEILKEKPEPVPQMYKEQVRDMLESRNSIESSATKDMDRSGYQTDVSTATWQFSTQSFSPRSVVSVNGAREDILKKPWPYLPADLQSVAESTQSTVTRNIRAEQKQRERYSSMPALDNSPIIRVKDDKPRSIMKRRELESREQMMYPQNQVVEHKSYQRSASNVSARPQVTETVQRFEETRRTEEVERRVQRKERRERRSRHHSSSRHGREMWENGGNFGYERRVMSLPRQPALTYRESGRAMTDDEMNKVVREAYEAADEAKRQHRGRSSSVSRGNGYIPSSQESYYKQTTTKRDFNAGNSGRYEDEAFGGRGLAHARYGSLSDSIRRGELKYIPNGDVREGFVGQNGRNMHKSYSTRDVFGGDSFDRRSVSSHRRGSQQHQQQQQMSPFVEFPPTLPRRGDSYRPVFKSRSYADWDDAGRAGFQGSGVISKRYDEDLSPLEAEFRDSLLMPVPRGNMNERDHRTEQIPGGYETFSKDNRANAGRRPGRDGQPIDFHESSQEYNFKREQEYDPRRR